MEQITRQVTNAFKPLTVLQKYSGAMREKNVHNAIPWTMHRHTVMSVVELQDADAQDFSIWTLICV